MEILDFVTLFDSDIIFNLSLYQPVVGKALFRKVLFSLLSNISIFITKEPTEHCVHVHFSVNNMYLLAYKRIYTLFFNYDMYNFLKICKCILICAAD